MGTGKPLPRLPAEVVNRLRPVALAALLVGFLGGYSARFLSAEAEPRTALSTAVLRGEVLDHDGAVCEGAQVELREEGLPPRTLISDADGQFSFAQLPAGNFELRVMATGFRTEIVRGKLEPGSQILLPPVTMVPTSNSSVTVSGDPVVVAREELHAEEQQRVLGLLPNFTVIYDRNAPPLSPQQKFQLAARLLVDPYTVLTDGATAGMEQAENDYKAYGNGLSGYMLRFGATYGNDVTGTLIGGALMPSLLHQDPRYFWKGSGTKSSRVLYALTSSVICRGDNGRRQLNYSSLIGDFAAAGISNAYYPGSDRHSAGQIVASVGLAKVADAAENIFQEFVARHFTRKAPTYADAK